MKKTKILIVSCSVKPFENNGQSKVIEMLSKELFKSQNFEVNICTFRPSKINKLQDKYDGIKYFYIKPSSNDYTNNYEKIHMTIKGYYNNEHLDQFKDILKNIQPDIVNFHSIQGLGVNLVEYSTSQQNIITIVNIHDYFWIAPNQFLIKANNNPYNSDIMLYEKWVVSLGIWEDYIFEQNKIDIKSFFEEKFKYFKNILNKVDIIIAPSKDIKNVYEKNGIKTIDVIPNPTYNENNKVTIIKKRQKNTIVFGHIGGSDFIGKGVDIAIKAISEIESNKIKLEIWGSYDLLSTLKEVKDSLKEIHKSPLVFIKKIYKLLKIAKNYFVNLFSNPKVSYWPKFKNQTKVLNRFDYLIVSSRYRESYSLAASEAIFHSIPVIASDIGGHTDFIVENVNGHLFEHCNYESLKNVIEKIIENKNLKYNFDKKNIISDIEFTNKFLKLITNKITKNSSIHTDDENNKQDLLLQH